MTVMPASENPNKQPNILKTGFEFSFLTGVLVSAFIPLVNIQ